MRVKYVRNIRGSSYSRAITSPLDSYVPNAVTTPLQQRNSKGEVTCEPFGNCERCPETEMHQPFCQPFGNRRLFHCRTLESEGEMPAWSSCGRIIAQEKADFFEFMACNIAFAVIGMVVLLWRSRKMAFMRSRTLAARIGVTRIPPGVP